MINNNDFVSSPPNIFDKKNHGVMTANAQYRPRLKSRDMASNQYKSFEGLANQKLIETFKATSQNPFMNKNSLPNIESQGVPERYMEYISKIKYAKTNSTLGPQRYQTPRDMHSPAQNFFHFQGMNPLSPNMTSQKKG